jgi:hypothetical protein
LYGAATCLKTHTPLYPLPPADSKGKNGPKSKSAAPSTFVKRKRTKAELDGDEDDFEDDLDGEEDDPEDEFEDEDYDDTKKGKPLARSASFRAHQCALKKTKQKAGKGQGNTTVIMRLGDDEEKVRKTYRKVKEIYDKLPPGNDNDHQSPSDDDEHGQGQKRKRKGKNRQSCQLSAKLSAHARLATHDVSYRQIVCIHPCQHTHVVLPAYLPPPFYFAKIAWPAFVSGYLGVCEENKLFVLFTYNKITMYECRPSFFLGSF